MKDMVSIRKMPPASLATIFGFCVDASVTPAMSVLLSEADEDFVRGDNRLV